VKRSARLALVVVVASCAGARDAPQSDRPTTPDTVTHPAPVVDLSFVQVAESTLRELRPDVSVRQWLEAHPRDSGPAWFGAQDADFQPNQYGPSLFTLGDWCARSTQRGSLDSGRVWIRHAYFYPPTLQPGAALPSLADSASARSDQCRLGLVWVESPEPDSARGLALAASVAAALRGSSGDEGSVRPSVTWRVAGTWKAQSQSKPQVFIVAFDTASRFVTGDCGEGCDETDLAKEDRRATVALAFLPRTAIGWPDFSKLDDYDHGPEWNPEVMLGLALEAAGVEGARARPLVDLMRRLRLPLRNPSDRSPPPLAADSFLTVVEPWLRDAQRLSGAQRGAALFAADLLLERTRYGAVPVGQSADGATRSRLAALGAKFASDVFEHEEYYAGNLRREVRSLLGGQLADSLFASEVEHPDLCADLRALALEAERYASQTTSREMQARAHLVAAAAQADIDLAKRDPGARRAAVQHYAAALAATTNDRLRLRAWNEGWRLVAGVAPVRIRFQCYEPD